MYIRTHARIHTYTYIYSTYKNKLSYAWFTIHLHMYTNIYYTHTITFTDTFYSRAGIEMRVYAYVHVET